jgi:hypothetical protein
VVSSTIKNKQMKFFQIVTAVIGFALLFSSCTDYGKKATKGIVEVYYKDGITENEAQKTAVLLASIDSTRNSTSKEPSKETKSMQLVKIADTVCYRMVTSKEKLAGIDDFAFEAIGNILSDSVFNGKPVNVELTDNMFNTFKKIPYKKIDFNNIPEQK